MNKNNKNFYFFQTPYTVAENIYKNLNLKNKKIILDVGAGKGALIRPQIQNKSLHKVAIEINKDEREGLGLFYGNL